MSTEDIEMVSKVLMGITNPEKEIRTAAMSKLEELRKNLGAITYCLLQIAQLPSNTQQEELIKTTALVICRKILDSDEIEDWKKIDNNLKNQIKLKSLELFINENQENQKGKICDVITQIIDKISDCEEDWEDLKKLSLTILNLNPSDENNLIQINSLLKLLTDGTGFLYELLKENFDKFIPYLSTIFQSHQLKLQLLEFKAIEDDNAFGSKVRINNNDELNNNNNNMNNNMNNIDEEEKNNYEENEEEEKTTKKQELLQSKKKKNKLALPDTTDVFSIETEEMNTDIDVPEIDMYNEKIKPLFEGTKVYKRFSEKAVKTEYEEYDPIKNKGILPEAYDYCLRKLYANINEKQFEFFTIDGLPKKEAILPFSQIHGIRYSDNAKKIIKLKEETPKTGTKTDFIGRDNIPFSIMTKKDNWDIVCPEYSSYVAIKKMIDTILSQPKPKNQIVAQIPSGDNGGIANSQEEEGYEEYYE